MCWGHSRRLLVAGSKSLVSVQMLMFGGVHVAGGRAVVISKLITTNILFLKRQVLTLSLSPAKIPPQPKRVVFYSRTQYRSEEVVRRGEGGGGGDALCEGGVGTEKESPVRCKIVGKERRHGICECDTTAASGMCEIQQA